TPDDFPTFPEAIVDTLTDRAKALLRILRVRPSQHAQFRNRTKLLALEPIARNVAVRRSNSDNRWILSTNTDMVFVPRRSASLADVAAALPDGYYALPRFEIPETLWESLDRHEPAAIIAAMSAWGRDFHLNEVVHAADPANRYDAPGDFQLMLRSDLWRIHGFHESMLLGWHVDSNLSKRLSLLPRRVGDVVDDIFGYHCDHTRQVTPMHGPEAPQNDLKIFVDDVTSADVPEQADTWGLAGEDVEEVNLDTTSRVYLQALQSAIPSPLVEPTHIDYTPEMHNRIDYSIDHVIPFLADIFASYRRDTIIGWLGAKKSFLERFAQVWKIMGFSEPIMVSKAAHWLEPHLPPGCAWASDDQIDERCQVFVFDFGRPDTEFPEQDWDITTDSIIESVERGVRRAVRFEQRRLEHPATVPRRFIGINTIHNTFQLLFTADVGAARTPIATRIRQGFVNKSRDPRDILRGGELDCMPEITLGPAGVYGAAPRPPYAKAIHAKLGVAGFIAFGAYVSLLPGRYEVTFEFFAERAVRGAALRVEVATDNGDRILAQQQVRPHEGLRRLERELRIQHAPLSCTLGFDVDAHGPTGDDGRIEFRVWSPGKTMLCLVAVRLRQVVLFSQLADE
ncbi:MAG TPA: hypothetical protein VGW96_07655, partial [Candidatus Eremiobacteraceae bacterium]|nr:hypothetical protein [Candidatus Eremiobacteraceae bacterium]